MKMRWVGVAAFFVLLAGISAFGHRLDEYLQATTISVEKDRVQAQIRLVPGVAVFPAVLASIDTNMDNVISEAEQRAYAERVLDDLSLSIDGDRLQPRLVSMKFPAMEEMKEGRGEIQIDFDAAVTKGGLNRKLIFENHHQTQIAAYLVNCLVPQDPGIQIIAQNRNYEQSYYQLDYVQSNLLSGRWSSAWWSGDFWSGAFWSGFWAWPAAAAVLLIAGFAVMWRLASTNDAVAPK
jgi:hypothetical protein